jgi:hypothetical protein
MTFWSKPREDGTPVTTAVDAAALPSGREHTLS